MPFISFPFWSSFSHIYFSSHFSHFSYLKHYYYKKVGVLEPPQTHCSAGPALHDFSELKKKSLKLEKLGQSGP